MSTYTQTIEETSMEFIRRMDTTQVQPSPSPIQAISGKLGEARRVFAALETQLTKKLDTKARQAIMGRFGPILLTLTFVEDAIRIPLRWSEQHSYMTDFMGLYSWFGALVLMMSFVVQLGGAWLVVRPDRFKPRRVLVGSYMLLAFTAIQPFMYGQHTDFDFLSRELTLAGGLMLLIWGEYQKLGRKVDIITMANAQEMNDGTSDRVQLTGRLLLTFLFLFQAIHSKDGGLHSVMTSPGFINISSFVLLFGLSLMVCTGFKTTWSSTILTLVLGVSNCWMYPFWSASTELHDIYKYYFFQTLSIMGGLMLLTLHGPGGLSLDGSKKKM